MNENPKTNTTFKKISFKNNNNNIILHDIITYYYYTKYCFSIIYQLIHFVTSVASVQESVLTPTET